MPYNNLFWIGAGVLGVIGFVLVFYYYRTKKLLEEMWSVDTYEHRELERMCSGGFNATVEVQGEVSCDEPVVSLAAGVACCWYNTVVEREERSTHTSTDSKGRTTTSTHYSWNSEMDVTNSALCKVTDKTGSTLVDPTRAEIDAETLCSEVVYSQLPWFDGVRMSDTGKYRIREKAFLPQGYAFVLGRAKDTPSGVLISCPEEGYADSKARYFIISRKTEKELTVSKQKTQKAYFWGAILTLSIAAYLVMIALGVVMSPMMWRCW